MATVETATRLALGGGAEFIGEFVGRAAIVVFAAEQACIGGGQSGKGFLNEGCGMGGGRVLPCGIGRGLGGTPMHVFFHEQASALLVGKARSWSHREDIHKDPSIGGDASPAIGVSGERVRTEEFQLVQIRRGHPPRLRFLWGRMLDFVIVRERVRGF